MIKKLVQKLESNPKNLFLIDAFGAMLSAFLLGVILVNFEGIFGIPASTLYILAAVPISFALYDFYCYQKSNHQLGPYLKRIAVMNLIYCCFSIGLGLYHQEVIRFWGWFYIVSEVAVITILTLLEYRIAKKLIQKYT